MYAPFLTAHREEFRQGCENLNKLLPSEERLSGIDHILDLIDFDHSNSIELNEFFEVSACVNGQQSVRAVLFNLQATVASSSLLLT